MKKSILIIFSGLILSANGFSQILYTDIEPDFFAEEAAHSSVDDYNHQYNYDVDNDFVDDFYISYHNQQNPGGVERFEGFVSFESCEFAIIQYPYLSFPEIPINEELQWYSNIMISPGYYEWGEPLDKFFALRKKINDDYYYGWIRLRNTYTLCDYAIKLIPNQAIWPGEGIPARAEYVAAQDINNNKNASDIQVSFEKAINEHHLASYRVFVVKAESAEEFDLSSANAISSASYVEIPIGSLSYSFELPADLLDSDGDPVMEFVPYKIFVLNIANQIDISENLLSTSSDEITLYSFCQEVTNLQVQENYQGGSTYNIDLFFLKPEEDIILEYRAIFIKPEDFLNGFNADSAMSLNEICYHSIVPTGNEISETLVSNTLKDYTGGFIEKKADYKLVILSVPDGANTNRAVITVSDQTINLSRKINAVYGVFAVDCGFSETASDVRISFNGLGANSGLAEYRVYACIPDDIPNFTNEVAQTLDAQKYYSFFSTESLISIILPEDFNDINGNPLQNEMPYRFFVQAIADSITKDVNSLSAKSNLLAISNPNYFVTSQTVGTNITYYDVNPDIGINSMAYSDPIIYSIDINNDGLADFEFYNFRSQSPGHHYDVSKIYPLHGNEIAVVYENFVDTMQSNLMLNEFLNWSDTVCVLNEYFYSSSTTYENGMWLGNCNYYLGIRIFADQDTLYGWIDVEVNQGAWNSPTVTIREFAYYNIHSFIDSFQGPIKCFDVYPNPANSFINLRIKDHSTSDIYIVYLRDLSGKIVKEERFYTEQITLGLKGIESGIYLLEIISNDNMSGMKKIVISK